VGQPAPDRGFTAVCGGPGQAIGQHDRESKEQQDRGRDEHGLRGEHAVPDVYVHDWRRFYRPPDGVGVEGPEHAVGQRHVTGLGFDEQTEVTRGSARWNLCRNQHLCRNGAGRLLECRTEAVNFGGPDELTIARLRQLRQHVRIGRRTSEVQGGEAELAPLEAAARLLERGRRRLRSGVPSVAEQYDVSDSGGAQGIHGKRNCVVQCRTSAARNAPDRILHSIAVTSRGHLELRLVGEGDQSNPDVIRDGCKEGQCGVPSGA
jgi:hypothetical protein